MTKFTRIATVLVSSVLLLATTQIARAQYGFTTWELGGQTNTIQSGDLISLRIMQGTASNIWYTSPFRLTVGTGNSMTNSLMLTGSDYYNLSNGSVTNGFYTGKNLNMNSLVTYPVTNKGNFFEGGISCNGSAQATSGTGSVATVTFQGYNPGPTNILVPVRLTGTTVGRIGGSGLWATPTQWSNRSLDYGNSSSTWIEIAAIPEPSAMALVGLGIAVCGMALRLRRKG